MVGRTRFELVTFCTPSNFGITKYANEYNTHSLNLLRVPQCVPHFAIDFAPSRVIYCCALANGVNTNNRRNRKPTRMWQPL